MSNPLFALTFILPISSMSIKFDYLAIVSCQTSLKLWLMVIMVILIMGSDCLSTLVGFLSNIVMIWWFLVQCCSDLVPYSQRLFLLGAQMQV